MSNMEYRYQIIVSSIKFRKGSEKFMVPIILRDQPVCPTYCMPKLISVPVIANQIR